MSAKGHSLPIHSGQVPPSVRYAPKATVALQCSERREVPDSDIRIKSLELFGDRQGRARLPACDRLRVDLDLPVSRLTARTGILGETAEELRSGN
jgi:hypothetical protein